MIDILKQIFLSPEFGTKLQREVAIWECIQVLGCDFWVKWTVLWMTIDTYCLVFTLRLFVRLTKINFFLIAIKNFIRTATLIIFIIIRSGVTVVIYWYLSVIQINSDWTSLHLFKAHWLSGDGFLATSGKKQQYLVSLVMRTAYILIWLVDDADCYWAADVSCMMV